MRQAPCALSNAAWPPASRSSAHTIEQWAERKVSSFLAHVVPMRGCTPLGPSMPAACPCMPLHPSTNHTHTAAWRMPCSRRPATKSRGNGTRLRAHDGSRRTVCGRAACHAACGWAHLACGDPTCALPHVLPWAQGYSGRWPPANMQQVPLVEQFRQIHGLEPDEQDEHQHLRKQQPQQQPRWQPEQWQPQQQPEQRQEAIAAQHAMLSRQHGATPPPGALLGAHVWAVGATGCVCPLLAGEWDCQAQTKC